MLKLSVSNIIWPKGKDNLESFFAEISSNNINTVELALSCIWQEPIEVTNKEIQWLRELLKKYQLKLCSLHSLTYTHPELELFRNQKVQNQLIDYLKGYIDIARKLECENIVFGSPKSRNTFGKKKEELNDLFVFFLQEIDFICEKINFNIEPLAKDYCSYLNSYMEGVNLLRYQSFKNIKIQFDIRSILESNENIEEIFQNFEYVRHAHTGNPGLEIPGGIWKEQHLKIKEQLQCKEYSGYISAEILNKSEKDPSSFLVQAINSTRKIYG